MSSDLYKRGDVVLVAYTGYGLVCVVTLDQEQSDTWLKVEQLTDYALEDSSPEFEVAIEFVSRPGEPFKPGPLTRIASMLGYDVDLSQPL